MKIQSYVLGVVSTNCYIVSNENTKEAIIIDPADQASVITNLLKEQGLHPVAILLTHGHFDHIMAAEEVAKYYHIPVIAGEAEKELLADPDLNGGYMIRKNITLKADQLIQDKDQITLAGLKIQMIHTPGHTAGGMCYYFDKEKILISGDTLFLESVGRTDLPTGNAKTLIESIKQKLMVLPDDVMVCPGHGDRTTIGYERTHNPYVGDNDFWD
ncbi:MBL fold metallo-hydrolase [Anaerocolumna sedimenticola]|uniref:MBL fold metallo-hydrolase n=1 Tax=Anaerocolumna sedimenticola TaxID=2696063 RepID=A0A6P1TLZ0_9FIRM|nr:MBL fold metallo-hydrolase [Anaerocolumna sedimenticola]QHQ61199.1 MBL fold metallo-hydrolase [Anaerocolumna sedimenticola]